MWYMKNIVYGYYVVYFYLYILSKLLIEHEVLRARKTPASHKKLMSPATLMSMLASTPHIHATCHHHSIGVAAVAAPVLGLVPEGGGGIYIYGSAITLPLALPLRLHVSLAPAVAWSAARVWADMVSPIAKAVSANNGAFVWAVWSKPSAARGLWVRYHPTQLYYGIALLLYRLIPKLCLLGLLLLSRWTPSPHF